MIIIKYLIFMYSYKNVLLLAQVWFGYGFIKLGLGSGLLNQVWV